MISKKVKRFCRDDISLIKNYDLAIADNTQMWDCHHRNELTFKKKELIKMNMYYNRPADELIFLPDGEHMSLHNKGKKHSEETKRKMSESRKGRTFSEETIQKIRESNIGQKRSEEARKKMSKAHSGKTLTEEHKKNIGKASSKALKGKIRSEFGKKFKEHFGITCTDNVDLYKKEHLWYRLHNNKCRWEVL